MSSNAAMVTSGGVLNAVIVTSEGALLCNKNDLTSAGATFNLNGTPRNFNAFLLMDVVREFLYMDVLYESPL